MSLTFDEARHFLSRTTFGGTPEEIRRVMQLDHGTAAPHFFMGGRVKGGFYGAPPSLKNLQAGDLKHTLDYRALYATVIEKWWGLPAMSIRNRARSGHRLFYAMIRDLISRAILPILLPSEREVTA